MKKKEKDTLKSSTREELQVHLSEKRAALFKARMDLVQHKLKNVRLVGRLRKDIAHMVTLLRKKEGQNA